MYLRINEVKGRKYISLVRSYREGGRVKQEHLITLGSYDELQKSGKLAYLTKKFNELSKVYDVGVDDIEEISETYCYGDVIYRKIWEGYGYDKKIEEWGRDTRMRFDIENVAYLMVIDRLLRPESRLALWKNQKSYINIKEVPLHNLYRCLDFLADRKEDIEGHTFVGHRHLFNRKVDVVFYDVTTFHFESERADRFREFGFSKSGQSNEVQVVMGILIDEEGHPIGFELFPGDTAEVKTFITAIESLKRRFEIGRVIFVADRGMSVPSNLYYLRERGYEYIVSARIRGLPASLKKQILSEDGFYVCGDGERGETFKYKEIRDVRHRVRDENGNYRFFCDDLVIMWSRDRYERDREERERMIEIAKVNYGKGVVPAIRRGWRRYLKIEKEGSMRITGIDEERIREDEKWDGYYGIWVYTKDRKIEPKDAISQIKRLWKIEETFRIYKSHLCAEPVFVWTPKRIIGHFVVCYMALVLERALENKIRRGGINASPSEIRDALNSMKIGELNIKGKTYYLRHRYNKLAGELLKMFRIKPPKALTPEGEPIIHV